MLARRMIGSLPQACPNCATMSTIGNMVDHLKKCPNRNYKCGAIDCGYSGVKIEFLKHIFEKHESKLLESFDKDIKQNEEEKKGP